MEKYIEADLEIIMFGAQDVIATSPCEWDCDCDGYCLCEDECGVDCTCDGDCGYDCNADCDTD